MAVLCPDCKATLDDPSKPCEWCGHAELLVPPATSPPKAGHARETAPPLHDYAEDTSELELPTLPPAPAPAVYARPDAPSHDESLDAGWGAAMGSPELAPPVAFTRASTREQILEGDGNGIASLELDMRERPIASAVSVRAIAFAPGPTSGGVLDRPAVDPVDVRMVAQFGPAPEAWWATPGYVRRVKARQRELEAQVHVAEVGYLAAKEALEDALVSIGQRAVAEIRDTVQGSRGAFLKTLDRFAKRETALKVVDPSVAADSERHREALRTYFEKIEETKYKLASGKTKELAAQLVSLQLERDNAERASRMPAKARDPAVERARAELRATCVDVAQLVLEDRTSFGEDYEEPRARVARLRNAEAAAETKVLVHRAAVNAFDENAVATGHRVMYAAAALAIVCVLMLVFILK